jgi:hypoxanthine phosphoribosyltransferase
LTWNKIQARVAVLGKEIASHYGEKPFIVMGLMNGAIFFMVDLLRQLPADWEILCPTVTSYIGTNSTGKLRGLENLSDEVKGRHVLLVDDILDTGLTLSKVKDRLYELGAVKIDICVLLRKRKKRKERVYARWTGFDIPDHYVIGCGFDYHGKYRGLKDIYIFDPSREKINVS